MSARSAETRPLSILKGVRILSFTQFLLGPAAVQYLADMGADVIKIETPGVGAWERTWSGGNAFLNGVSVFYLLAHRNVRSLTLNLKHPAGAGVARRLIASADVLVENFRPGVMEKLGLGYAEVARINPGIVYASASGYGQDSPSRDLPGQDLLIQAMSGLAALTGRAGQDPIPAGAAIVDQHGAALLAMSVLGALFHRERTGEGHRIEANMVQAALDLQLEPIVYYLNGGTLGRPLEPLGSTYHPAPYGIYPTLDGHLALSLSPVKLVARALGSPPELEAYEDPDLGLRKRDEIYRALAPLLLARTTAKWLDVLRSQGVWCAAVHDYADVFADPAVQHLDPLLEMDHPQAGRVRLLKHPVRYSSGEPELRRIPPELGADSADVLREIGYSGEEIDQLRTTGTI